MDDLTEAGLFRTGKKEWREDGQKYKRAFMVTDPNLTELGGRKLSENTVRVGELIETPLEKPM